MGPHDDDGGLVAFLAVNEDAKAIERKKIEGMPGENYSLFTHFLLQALAQPGLESYRQVANETQALIARQSQHNPTPVFQGELDRRLDGDGVTWIAQQSGQQVRIEAGSIAGLAKGTIVALETGGRPTKSRVGCARLTEIQPAWSLGESTGCPDHVAVAPAATQDPLTARVLEPVVWFQLVVARPPVTQCEPTTSRPKAAAAQRKPAAADLASITAAIEKLRQNAKGDFPVDFVAAGQPALIQLCVHGDDVYLVGENGHLDVGKRRRTMSFSTAVPIDTLADDLQKALWKILRQQNLIRIARETAAADIAAKVAIDIRLVRDGGALKGAGDVEKRACVQKSAPTDPKAGTALKTTISQKADGSSDASTVSSILSFDDRISHCDRLQVAVTNGSGKDIDVTLLYLDSEAGIGPLARRNEARISKDDRSARVLRHRHRHLVRHRQVAGVRSGGTPRSPATGLCADRQRAPRSHHCRGLRRRRAHVLRVVQEGHSRTRSAARSGRFDKLLEDAGLPGELRSRGVERGGDAAIRIFQWEVVPPAELTRRAAR